MSNKILERMLERLFAGLVSGPNLNCRPHASRQRVDFSLLAKLQDLTPEEVLEQLLGDDKKSTLTARAARPPSPKEPTSKPFGKSAKSGKLEAGDDADKSLSPAAKAIEQAWSEQKAVLGKLRILADEARTYEQDTGVHVLNIGLPLLSLPPGTLGGGGRGAAGKRILAPIAFIPVEISIQGGPTPSVEITCQQNGVDAITPNTALLAWLEQQTGQTLADAAVDQPAGGPWQALAKLVEQVARILKFEVPEPFADFVNHPAQSAAPAPNVGQEGGAAEEGTDSPKASSPREDQPATEPKPWRFRPSPRNDDEDSRAAIVPAAVLGLFPINNQGLLRDTQAMLAEEKLDGPHLVRDRR